MACSPKEDYSDLAELCVESDDPLTVKFDKAAKHMQHLAANLDNDTLLKMYSYYKQGLDGPCNVPKPSWYDMRGKAKWEAWKQLGDMPREQAKNLYVEGVLKLDENFRLDMEDTSPKESWARVSLMCPETPSHIEKNIVDHIRNDNIKEVETYLKNRATEINSLDNKGMGLIHWAADIGNAKMLELIISSGADKNLQDCEGQTALHYAACCGHVQCVKLLLSKGARTDILDINDSTAESMASDDTVKGLFQ